MDNNIRVHTARYARRLVFVEAVQVPAHPSAEERDALQDFAGEIPLLFVAEGVKVYKPVEEEFQIARPGDYLVRNINLAKTVRACPAFIFELAYIDAALVDVPW